MQTNKTPENSIAAFFQLRIHRSQLPPTSDPKGSHLCAEQDSLSSAPESLVISNGARKTNALNEEAFVFVLIFLTIRLPCESFACDLSLFAAGFLPWRFV
jgi:hypothetical protein